MSYSDHISEVFIKPIRSVLAIDDRFPTLDGLVSADSTFTRDEHSDRLSKLLQFCRSQHPHWMVDVHDGKGIGVPDMPLASLRQCSWLILDYKLDGDTGDGSRAVSVLRSLASSQNFNLVVVYTGEKADPVLHHLALALSIFGDKAPLSEEEALALDAKLREWEDEDSEIVGKLRKAVSSSVCFSLLQNKSFLLRDGRNTAILGDFNRLVSNAPEALAIPAQSLLHYIVQRVAYEFAPRDETRFHTDFSPSTSTNIGLLRGIFLLR